MANNRLNNFNSIRQNAVSSIAKLVTYHLAIANSNVTKRDILMKYQCA